MADTTRAMEYPAWLTYTEDAVAGIEIWRCRDCGAEQTRSLGELPQFNEHWLIHKPDCVAMQTEAHTLRAKANQATEAWLVTQRAEHLASDALDAACKSGDTMRVHDALVAWGNAHSAMRAAERAMHLANMLAYAAGDALVESMRKAGMLPPF